MPRFNLELCNHPAQARNAVTGKPLVDSDGAPVPLFPDQRAIKFEGRVIAYVGPTGGIAFIVPESKLTSAVVDDAKQLVNDEFMPVSKSHVVADRMETEIDVWEDDEDE